jgi:hypothetical protein
LKKKIFLNHIEERINSLIGKEEPIRPRRGSLNFETSWYKALIPTDVDENNTR